MMRLPKTVPIPVPEPNTTLVTGPDPINLAAVLMSLETTLGWKLLLGMSRVRGFGTAKLLKPPAVNVVVDSIPLHTVDESAAERCFQEQVEKNLKQTHIF